jgi:anti-sigma B factor antagonist
MSSGVLIAEMNGRSLDASNSKEFKSAVEPLLESNAKLVFDFRQVDFVDSTGLGALVSCLRRAHTAAGEIKLCGLNKPVRALLELVRMHRVFEIFNNADEAVSSYQN